ncbi:hypothetical protein C8J57DRAFT_1253114 [Mycena rebaudengoi]|nr:hypothetical protein C8J57DRAFT_1253114 [Mycena rebaudengoi]
MDMGTPAGALGPTRTRTRKNRTRVRVGSKTRTGYPRVLNAPAGPQIRRISASSWARARLRFLRLHAVIKSFIRSAAERGGGRAVVGEVRQTAPVREDTLDGDGSTIRGYTGRNIVWSSNASLNDLEVLSSSMIRISKVQRSPFAPSLLRQLESRAGWHSDLVRICGPASGDVLDTYHAPLTELGAHPLHESKLCTDFLLFAGHFHDHIETAELILATPGFPFMITRAWLFIHELDPKLMKVKENAKRRTGATMNTQDYLIAENDGFFIYLQLLLFMRSYPNEPYYIMFDYTKGGVQSLQTEVRPTALRSTPSAEVRNTFVVDWEDAVSRVARSAGKMELQLMTQIHTRRIWMVPLRTESSYVRNELGHIASHLPADSKTWDLAKVAEAIRDVIYQEDPDAIAIH